MVAGATKHSLQVSEAQLGPVTSFTSHRKILVTHRQIGPSCLHGDSGTYTHARIHTHPMIKLNLNLLTFTPQINPARRVAGQRQTRLDMQGPHKDHHVDTVVSGC